MKKRLFLHTTLIICGGLLCFFAASVYITHKNNLNIAKDTVMETAQIYADLYDADTDLSAFVKAGSGTRVTIISPDGDVLADTRPLDMSAMENHLSRPEIQAVRDGAPAAHVRYSDTLATDLVYYALQAESGDSFVYVRVAIPVERIDSYLLQSLPLLVLLLLLVALLCFLFTRSMVNRIISPFEAIEQKLRLLSKGAYTPEAVGKSYAEMDEIVREMDEVALVLQNSFAALREEKLKVEYILNNIGDGLLVLDEDRNIVLINAAATETFVVRPSIVGKHLHYLSYDQKLLGAVDECLCLKKDALFDFVLRGRIFLTAVKALPGTALTMIVFSDVTESRENAKRREEFFANASHELKTPLTAIKGFNELSALHSKEEAIRRYIDGITRETDRMLTLIGDMLKLSELENAPHISPNPVSLAKMAEEAREALSAVICEKSIHFELHGDAEVSADPEHVYEVMKNLVENAVRYNECGGRVSVAIESGGERVKLTISDSGIGIPPEDQTRIFERFYRVEKSRSQRNGGTGLGLSIVKHICALYDWNVSLKSKLGAGTEVTVLFSGYQGREASRVAEDMARIITEAEYDAQKV